MTDRKRVVIVGGVAGGASAAARARRLSEDAEIILFERGRYVSFANCGLPYHVGGTIVDRKSLLIQTPEGLRKRFGLDVRTRHEVLAIDRQARQVAVRNLETGQDYTQPYDVLILSPGAEPIRPPIPLESKLVMTLRGMEDMDRIKKVIDESRPARAVVVGGGYIGLEMAEALRQRKVEVTLVERFNQVFAAADPEMVVPLHQQLTLHGVDLRLGQTVSAIREAAAGQLRVELSTGQAVECGLVILAVGVRPESKLAREAGLAIGPSGGIVVDEHMRTSDESIYAVGDAVEAPHIVSGQRVVIPLAGPANRQGRIAADNAFGRPSVYRGSQGTAVCKVFDLTIGMTGLTEKQLVAMGRPYEKIYIHPASHAGYYPGSAPLSLKLLFDLDKGSILGAQAVGAKGVDKRIDVIATAQRGGLTVRDLTDLELSYAPPYGSAKDPVNYAGFVASNVLDGDAALCHYRDVTAPRPNQLLLDVRTPAEVQTGTIPGSINIPVDELRTRLGELPRDRETLAFCQVGLRGYLACRILSQHGLACRNLSGGYKTYSMFKALQPPTDPVGAKVGPGPGAAPASIVAGAPDACVASAPGASPASAPGDQGPRMAFRGLSGGEAAGNATNAGAAASAPSGGAVDSGTPGDQGPRKAFRGLSNADPAPNSGGCCCAQPPVAGPAPGDVVREIDARAVQCPGPIMRLNTELQSITPGQAVRITVCDHGFAADVAAWCRSTGNQLVDLAAKNGDTVATIAKGEPAAKTQPDSSAQQSSSDLAKHKTLVIFSGDFDRAMASFIIANGAAAMGSQVTMFFTFWGLNILRRPEKVKARKNLIERMFGWMMPRGADKLALSRMNMGGMGLRMIKGIMRKKNVNSLPELIASARSAGVRLVACSMSMDLMGIRREELIDGVEEGGVAAYLAAAEEGNVNLFI